MGYLTTHVLDTARGEPAANMAIDLYRVESGKKVHLKSVTTNQDGRVNGPILSEAEFATGVFELCFQAGAYLRIHNKNLDEPLFLDIIPIQFGMSDGDAHYHVPLLLSPYSYSTYRGS